MKSKTKLCLLFFTVAPGIVLFQFCCQYRRRILARQEQRQSRLITDREFTGFKLLKTYPPHLDYHCDKQYCVLPTDIAEFAAAACYELDGRLHPLDVFVASYPKSGTTWLSEVVFLLINRLDWDAASAANLEERVPYLEYIWPGPEELSSRLPPRIIKTHLPFFHLPEKVQLGKTARIIYIVRDPRDVVVSYYHFARCFTPAGYINREGVHGFSQRFLDDRLPYSPWSTHVQSYCIAAAQSRNDNNTPKVLIIQYERLKVDPKRVVRQIEEFLHATWDSDTIPKPEKLSEEELSRLVDHCSFESMARNPQTNYSWFTQYGLWKPYTNFMRRGVIGDHQSTLSSEHTGAIEQMAMDAGLQWTLFRSVNSPATG